MHGSLKAAETEQARGHKGTPEADQWERPPAGMIKLNTDASYVAETAQA